MTRLLFASDDVIPGKHNQTTYWFFECWQPIAQNK